MELVSLAKEVFQNAAEHAASYRLGQTALRHLDRTLWVVEKCARWAVPPPLDQDERPQPELVRPLPWVFFLAMLVTLRITRECISLLNLVMGKPPLRSADVVMYIQSKRRYLRTLKYQGNRLMRARTSTTPPQSWTNAIHSLFEFTMCFRRQSAHYGNNNTTRVSNNDQVLVVKRSKRVREPAPASAGTSETTMERLIEKMMIDLDADSDEDSSFTLTTVTSPKSDRSDFTIDSDQDATFHNNISTIHNENDVNIAQHAEVTTYSDITEVPSSTPEKSAPPTKEIYPTPPEDSFKEESKRTNDTSPSKIPRTPNSEQKIANGRTVKSVPSKKKGTGGEKERRSSEQNKSVSGNNTM
ncbi:jabba [Anticarsia gemmatalis]|uniref:jabba n=1 Tax=Anticarsia gemmatalis TaxID=129554 RepID=UPI003F759A38